jgi:hypothetical protein
VARLAVAVEELNLAEGDVGLLELFPRLERLVEEGSRSDVPELGWDQSRRRVAGGRGLDLILLDLVRLAVYEDPPPS